MADKLKARIYKFDNIKFCLIILVVLGHVIEGYTDRSDMFKSLFVFIYSFHMPLFVFLCGLFQKRFSKDNKLKISKIVFYITLGYLMKLLIFATKTLADMNPKFNFFGGSAVDWFLFVIAAYTVLAFLLQKVHPAIVLSVVFVLGCVSGYFDFIKDFLFSSRCIVFMPVYFVGYYLTPQKVMDITAHWYVKIPSALFMIGYFVLSFRQLDTVYKLRRLFTGKNPFSAVPIDNCGAQNRLMCYAISAILCIAVISFVPNIKIPIISHMGENTLAVYFWHNPCMYTLRALGVLSIISSTFDPMWKVLIITLALALGFVLSFDIFNYPLKKLSQFIDYLCSLPKRLSQRNTE